MLTIQEEIEALKAEIADDKARTAEANAQIAACDRKTAEYNAKTAKTQKEIMKVLSHPNFQEAEKQRILAKMKALDDEYKNR